MYRLNPGRLTALLIAALALAAPAQTTHAEADRVTAAVDAQSSVQLGGHLPRWAEPGGDLGAVGTDIQLDHLTVMLSRSAASQAAFEQLLADQQNPGSPRYHHWLTPQQVGAQYGPTQHDIDAVTQWLQSSGLRVDAVSPDRTMITFRGASSRVAHALGTEFHRYAVRVNGTVEQRLSIHSEPQIPAALAPVIAGFHGLSEEHLQPQSHATTVQRPQSQAISPDLTASNGSHYMTPGDFATIFDLKTLYNAGTTGSGVKVAIIGRSEVQSADISSFETYTAIATTAQPVLIVPTNGTNPGYSGDEGEQTLDVERVLGTAPGAEPDLIVSASSQTSDGIQIAAEYEVGTRVDPIMTISYGACESSAGSAGDSYWSDLFSTAVSEGITVFISSGDSGAAGCDTPFELPPNPATAASINYICASPYVTCMGGTEFNDTANPSTYWNSSNGTGLTSALSYIPEGAWNEPTSGSSYQVAGTGGGVSLYVTKPSWQTGTGVPADGFRDTPDLALPASEHDGYFGCYQGSCNGSGFTAFAGTSAAAPGMAGIMALVVQTSGGIGQGNINPAIYRLAANTSAGAFHDATPASSGVSNCSVATPSMCNNSIPSKTALTGGTAGFALTTGYDLATGWGSVDAAKLVSGISSSFNISNGAPFSVTAGSSGSSSVTITAVTGFTGTVALSCAITSQPTGSNSAPTCTVSPSSVTLTSGSSTTAVVSVGTTARPEGVGMTAAGIDGLGAALILLLPVRRRRLYPLLAMLLLGGMLGSAIGCSGGGGAAPGTLAGSYTATVTGTSGLMTQTAAVNFTVN